ncbi:MAG: hypothetical protein RMJ43_02105 [Chloroherpetonaceae bacterium]|nr:hypothetical protein [Chthonomonadaceae bacterium]MDW8206601.1 hypothetical protein [Chloroherpetonaceae bacterium]
MRPVALQMERRAFLWTLMLSALAGCRSLDRAAMRQPSQDDPPLPGPYQDIGPRWSPDGRRIAFLRRTPDRRQQLCLADARLRRIQPLLEPELVSPDRLTAPSYQRYVSPDTIAWSPDGRYIAFPRVEWFTFAKEEQLPGTGLWRIDTATGRVEPLALHPPDYREGYYYYRFPHWSPDGRYLSFVGEGLFGQRMLFVRALHAQRAEEVSPRFDTYEDSDWPVWHWNRRRTSAPMLVYRRAIQRTPVSPRTETLRRIYPGHPSGEDTGTLWRIRAFDHARLLERRGDRPRDPDTGPVVLTQSPGPGSSPMHPVAPRTGHLALSPDGRYLAFTLTPDAMNYRRYDLWTLDLTTGQARCVRPAESRGYLAPVWIDNNRIGALLGDGTRFTVVAVVRDTGQMRTLGALDSADCDWSPDRRWIVYAPDREGGAQGSSRSTTLRLLETGVSAW